MAAYPPEAAQITFTIGSSIIVSRSSFRSAAVPALKSPTLANRCLPSFTFNPQLSKVAMPPPISSLSTASLGATTPTVSPGEIFDGMTKLDINDIINNVYASRPAIQV
ncbi:MAG: hypothetical protein ACD_52C00247G0001 [uncultured bacterium]|nr:MAG: hypothetical protein ACD_52C00247G0001 [uncultured bacterium]